MAIRLVNKEQAILSKLNQRPLDSKKCVYAIYGSACVLLVFATSAFLILNHAEAAKDIVELANLVTMFFGAVVTTLITGTAVMDWKATSALQHIDEDRHIDSNEEAPEVEVNQRVVKPRYFDSDDR
jgi:hypothetical protein